MQAQKQKHCIYRKFISCYIFNKMYLFQFHLVKEFLIKWSRIQMKQKHKLKY